MLREGRGRKLGSSCRAGRPRLPAERMGFLSQRLTGGERTLLRTSHHPFVFLPTFITAGRRLSCSLRVLGCAAQRAWWDHYLNHFPILLPDSDSASFL